jgi:phosphate-selective porin OprO/OprP
MTKRSLGGAAIAVAVSLAVAGVARADDASDALAQRVKDLERELADVKSTLRGGYFTANSDLEARVGELERVAADGGMAGVFKHGLKHESADGAFTYQFFGLIQNDWAWWRDDDDNDAALGGDLNPGTEFRRIRLGANGRMYGNVRWHSEVELTDNIVRLADVWIETDICITKVRVGHQKEPIGFDQLTSDRFTQFMERSFVNALSPQRNTGILFWDRPGDGPFLYQVGMFRDSNSAGDDTGNLKDGEYNLSGRFSGHWAMDEQSWFHAGVSGRMSDIADDAFAIAVGPAINQAPAFIGGAVAADDAWQVGLEAAFVTGPFTFLAEYGRQEVDILGGDSSTIRAVSAEAAVWLTGESTPYDKNKGTFGRTSPRNNFDGDGDGTGAFQVALRHDRINMNDGDLDGGAATQWTLAGRWWLNPNTAVHLNLVRFNAHDPGFFDPAWVFGMCFEIDF